MEYGLLLSLILGIDSELSPQLEAEFKRTGLTHLLVFSGAQTTIMYLSANWIFRALAALLGIFNPRRIFFKVSFILAFIATLWAVLAIGVQVSAVRALIACWLTAGGDIFESNRGMLYRMFMSVVILALIWPVCFLEVGVQLTYAALFGIWMGMQLGKGFKGYGWMCITISVSTNIVTFCWFRTISPAGLLLNPFLAPTVSALSVYAGIPSLLGFYFDIPILRPCGEYFLIVLSYLESLVHWFAGFPWAFMQF